MTDIEVRREPRSQPVKGAVWGISPGARENRTGEADPAPLTRDGGVDTAVIVLNWNGRDDTIRCLQSLKGQVNAAFRVIVVDNGSADDSVSAIRRSFPEVEIVETGENLGYAEGNNVGIRRELDAGAEYVLVVNNDTILESDCVSAMVREARAHPEAAAIGAKNFSLKNQRAIYNFGGRFDWMGRPRLVKHSHTDDVQTESPQTTAWLSGCAILFNRRALEQVGLFDPRYFLLFEETDWCIRARRANFTLRLAPEAHVWHERAASFGSKQSAKYLYYYTRNHFLWVERTATPLQMPIRYLGAVYRALHSLYRARKESPSVAWALRIAVLRGFLDYSRRRFGRCNLVTPR